MDRRKSAILNIVIAASILTLLWPLESRIERSMESSARRQQAAQHENRERTFAQLPGIYRFFQLAGLNSLLADILWMKADDLWHSSSWWQMEPVMESIVEIDPSFVMVWQVLGWHLGWNLPAACDNEVERSQWLQKAADAYDRAIQQNPENQELWMDRARFYLQRTRQYDKATFYLEAGVKKFPADIDNIQRSLQRVYEHTWRVDDAVNTIKDILAKRPNDLVAKRDLEWWSKYHDDLNWRWVLEFNQHANRWSHNLPPYRNPFEGQLVNGKLLESPPWRDWEAPYYMDLDWKPRLSGFSPSSLAMVFEYRPDLVQEYYAAHPELPRPQAAPQIEPGRIPMPSVPKQFQRGPGRRKATSKPVA